MAANAKLEVEVRTERGKSAARKLRGRGRVPAVLYGRHEETRLISVERHELEKLFAHITVGSTLIDLQFEGQRRPVPALVREVQRNPVSMRLEHVDFLVIHANEPVDVVVPIRLTGTAVGVKEGGVLQQVLHELPIRCLPRAIPEAIEADVSHLAVGDSLHVGDLKVPEGITVEVESDRTICTVQPPTVVTAEEEEAVSVPEAGAGVGGHVEPELIRKRPQEEEQPPATEAG